MVSYAQSQRRAAEGADARVSGADADGDDDDADDDGGDYEEEEEVRSVEVRRRRFGDAAAL